jgi:hypothetical protein
MDAWRKPKGMKFKLQSQSYFRVIRMLGLSAGLMLAGCGNRKPQASDANTESKAAPAPSEIAPNTEPVRTPVPSRAPTTPKPRVAVVDAPSDPAEIAKEYRATTDVERRGEFIDALWNLDSPAAVEVLRQLFLTERDVEVKVDIVAGLSDSKKPETREGRFGLVVSAMAQGQPKDVRELAAQMLVDFDDPRAVGLLQQFTQDADPDMREAAKEALETRRAVEQP